MIRTRHASQVAKKKQRVQIKALNKVIKGDSSGEEKERERGAG